MSTLPCPRTDDTAAACRSGEWDEALRHHVASCPDCQETTIVAGALRRLAEGPAPQAAPLPDPALLFRKAQILARFRQDEELTRRAMRPVHVAQWTALAATLAGIAWAAGSAAAAAFPAGRLTGFSLTAALALAVALRLMWAEE